MDRSNVTGLLAGLGMVSVLAGCREAVVAPVAGPPVVAVAAALQRDVPVVVELIGQTEATANVEIRPRIDGTVERIEFAEGSEVKVICCMCSTGSHWRKSWRRRAGMWGN